LIRSKKLFILGNASYSYEFASELSIESRLDINRHDVVSNDSVANTGYERGRSELSWMIAVRKSFFDRINLNFMLRQDWIDFNIVPVIPYFGFDFRVIPGKQLIIKGNIARNFHQPTLNDLYWVPGGNPDLLPEKGFSYEAGMAYTFNFNKQKITTELTYFYSDIDNWIIWIPGFKGYWEPQNIRRVVSQGVEWYLKAEGSFGEFDYSILGNYAYTSSVNNGDPVVWGDESTGEQLPYIPLHSGNAFFRLAWKGFFITYQHNSYSERYTTTSNDPASRRVLYPYFMNDMSVGKDFVIDRVTLSTEFKVFNLFDETYHTILYRPMPGRNYLLTIMFRFE
jgi:iron complex outermembrane receptor protein